MPNNAGFGFSLTDQLLFKLANSSDSIDKTTLEGFRSILNENFQVNENELLGILSVLYNQSVISKLKYRNSTYLVPNLILNSDFSAWDSGIVFTFNSLSASINIANNWVLNPGGCTGSCSRQPMIPQNQTDVPEYPDYYLLLAVSNYSSNPSLSQRINNIIPFNGLTYTISGYFKSSVNGLRITPKIRINFGTGNINPEIILSGSDFVLNQNFGRYNSTFNFPTDLATKATAGSFIEVYFEVLEQGIYNISLSSVQFELGSTPTPYKANSFLEAQSLYLVDTTLGSIELKLKPNPSQGDVFGVFDVKGNFQNFKLTLNPNGKKITNSFLSISIIDKYSMIMFMYINDDIGWVITSNSNPVNLDSGGSKVAFIQSICGSIITGI